MFKRLKAALRKARHRTGEREADQAKAERKAHRLTGEMRDLKRLFETQTTHQAETIKAVEAEERKAKPDQDRLSTLRQQRERGAEELRYTVRRIQHKRGKRSHWRTRARKARKRARWWVARQTTLRKKLKAAKKHYEETHGAPPFESWMLNGCPEIHNDRLKKVIAFVVVACDQYITATTNGTHVPGSYHYSEQAADWGAGSVSSMQSAANQTRDEFGDSYFVEFFSPCDWWIKYGVPYPGYFPGHGDHGHTGVTK